MLLFIKRYTDEVILAYDSDGAGVRAALRAIPILKEAGLKIKVLHLHPYKDPDEFIKNMGTDAFEKRLEEAENSFMFEISVIEKNHDFNDPQGKTDFYNETAKKLLEFSQEIERNNYIEAVARKYGIAFNDLQKLVNSYGARIGYTGEEVYERQQTQKKTAPAKEDAILTSQKLLLTWLADDPSLFKKITPYIGPENFEAPIYHKAAVILFEDYEKPAKLCRPESSICLKIKMNRPKSPNYLIQRFMKMRISSFMKKPSMIQLSVYCATVLICAADRFRISKSFRILFAKKAALAAFAYFLIVWTKYKQITTGGFNNG